jgi:hypothetical protein
VPETIPLHPFPLPPDARALAPNLGWLLARWGGEFWRIWNADDTLTLWELIHYGVEWEQVPDVQRAERWLWN